MKIKAIKCSKCEDVIFSRANHDYRSCSCGSLAVDGGHYNGVNWAFSRIIGTSFKMEELWLNTNLDEGTLYDDWNSRKDKYGLIKGNPKMPKKTATKK